MNLKKHLQNLRKEDLVEEILKLAKKFKEVKNHYEMDLGGQEKQAEIVAEFKQKIKKQYFPTRGYGDPKASEVRKILSDFKKISIFPYDIVDLTLYRVEMAVNFTNAYGDIDEQFYNSTENNYEDALKIIRTNGLEAHFINRCMTIAHNCQNIGWGFGDTMNDLTEEYLDTK
jgi:Family of unknown function (DUF6155)